VEVAHEPASARRDPFRDAASAGRHAPVLRVRRAGGAADKPTLPVRTLQACIFPDLSTNDSFGLFYHTNGVIRGTDLTAVVRYRPGQMPATPSPR
jgi:hypothetical protein